MASVHKTLKNTLSRLKSIDKRIRQGRQHVTGSSLSATLGTPPMTRDDVNYRLEIRQLRAGRLAKEMISTLQYNADNNMLCASDPSRMFSRDHVKGIRDSIHKHINFWKHMEEDLINRTICAEIRAVKFMDSGYSTHRLLYFDVLFQAVVYAILTEEFAMAGVHPKFISMGVGERQDLFEFLDKSLVFSNLLNFLDTFTVRGPYRHEDAVLGRHEKDHMIRDFVDIIRPAVTPDDWNALFDALPFGSWNVIWVLVPFWDALHARD
jgi:hypothetical protein